MARTFPGRSSWLFLRHGESTANAARRLSGWENVALTPRGEEQAREAGKQLASQPLGRVLSSDLQRAYRTAELSLKAWEVQCNTPSPSISCASELRERNLGEFQGQELDHLRASGQVPLLLGWETRPPGGESHRDIAARSLPYLAHLEVIEEPTLVVAHGGLLRTLIGLLDNRPLEEIGRHRIANAVVIERELEPGRWMELAMRHGGSS